MPAPADLLPLLDRRLAALRTARPDLHSALDLQEQLLRAALTSARPPHAEPVGLPREQAAERIRAGVPLLHDQPISVDIHFAADLFSRLVNLVQQRGEPDMAPRLQALVHAATSGNLDPHQLFTEAFVQHQDHLVELAQAAGVDAELLLSLAAQAVAPQLRAYAQHLLPIVERLDDGSVTGVAWRQGYCPVCGAWPILGELRGVELAQFLRCGGCGAGWRSRRLFCPYCGTDDHHLLQTLQVEGEQRFRIAVCDRCKGYLKVGNAFEPPPAELVVLDDLSSLHLDLVAIERGYHRPAGSGFVIELAVPDDEWVQELA